MRPTPCKATRGTGTWGKQPRVHGHGATAWGQRRCVPWLPAERAVAGRGPDMCRLGRWRWCHRYSPRTLYGLPDLSLGSWESLAKRMDEDDDLFQTYYQAFTGFPAIAVPCTDAWEPSVYSPHGGGGKCKTATWCPVLAAGSDSEYHACISERNQTTPSRWVEVND